MPVDGLMQSFARHWWVLLLRGVVAVLFGLMAFFLPGLTLVTLILLCGFYFLMDGFTALVIGGRAHVWPLALAGVLGVIAGILTFFYPAVTALTLLIFLAVWAIGRGTFEIIAAIRLRKELTNEWLLISGGLLSILFGVLLLVSPAAGALAMVWLIGAYAMVFGIVMCMLAFRLRGLLAHA
jgi:uncharacterized membrane protein HdeD (DUF308 family)